MIRLFTDGQLDAMAGEVRRLLLEVGYAVEHDAVKGMAVRSGCRESPAGRLLFDPRQVEELAQRLRREYPPSAPAAPGPRGMHPRRPLGVGFGNLTPKFYDYARGEPVGGSTPILLDLVKFAQAEPRVRMVTIPVSRQDSPPQIEQLQSVCLMARWTDKRIGSVDATVPQAVPFLAEMGEALGEAPADFVGCCNCINPPLRLEERTAETMVQRSRYHARSMITTMPCLGGTAPVDVYAAVVQAVAEIVGGLILSVAVDPQAPLLGYVASVQLDMRSGTATSSSPQTVQVDAGVCHLMARAFGGGTRVGGRSYVSARRPGLAALMERFLKAAGYAAFLDEGVADLAGNGNLDNGSTISPEQFLLDLDAMEGLDALRTAPAAPPPGDAVDRIRQALAESGGSFLAAEHTLANYRDHMWDPAYFRRGVGGRTEKEMLDRCHADYHARLGGYVPASRPAQTLRDLDRILNAACASLLG